MNKSYSKYYLLVFFRLVFLFSGAVSILACNSGTSDKGSSKKNGKTSAGSISVLDDGVFMRQTGRWQSDSPALDELEQKQLEELGYLTGYEAAAHKGGVTIHDVGAAHPGYNLYTSGHFKGAALMNMKGDILHQWKFDPNSEFIFPLTSKRKRMGTKYMRRTHLFPNGDLLVLFDFVGLARIDKDSKKIWFKKASFHHDMFVHENGDIYTLDEEKTDGSILGFEQDIFDNSIVVLSKNGKEKKKVSLAQCFARSLSKKELGSIFTKKVLSRVPKRDVFHANSIQVLAQGFDGRHHALKKGNVLISIRSINTIAVINMEKETVELNFRGDWIHQHEARAQKNGNILFFDNKGKGTHSRIVEFDPKTTNQIWTYVAKPPKSFYSRLQGTVDRLPGGNTLVVESAWGRAFELNPRKQKVWEFISPHRSTDDRELIAVLFDMTRIEADFPVQWIGEGQRK